MSKPRNARRAQEREQIKIQKALGPLSGREIATQKELNDAFLYDADTGILTWKRRPRESFSSLRQFVVWNIRYPGTEAGNKRLQSGKKKRSITTGKRAKSGMCVGFNGSIYMAGRIIWTMVHGLIPKRMVIDHINGDPWDNRLCNLRCITTRQNTRNRGVSYTSKTGVSGVHMVRGRFRARIRINRATINIGYFDTLDKAKAAREREEKKHFRSLRRVA